jgi:hypothetical protein
MNLASRRDTYLAFEGGPRLAAKWYISLRAFAFREGGLVLPYAGTPARNVKESSHLRFMVFCELTQRRN